MVKYPLKGDFPEVLVIILLTIGMYFLMDVLRYTGDSHLKLNAVLTNQAH